MKNKSDIAALESVSFAKNYNDYVLKLISKNLDKNDKILDFGAGYGLFTKMLIDCGYDVISVEINDEAIKKLNKKNIKNYKSVKEINEKIDCVISLNVLEHIDDDFETLLMLNNAMPNGGKLILYLPASNIVWSNLDEMVNHKRRYSKKNLQYILSKSNFEIESIFYADFIGWLVLLIAKILKINLDFNQKKIIFYDKFIFKNFKYLDFILKNFIGKNIFVVAEKKRND